MRFHRPSWRERATAALAALRLQPTKDPGEIARQKVLIRDAYPFGERAMTPYKVWLDQCHRMHPWLYPVKQEPPPAWLRPKGEA